MDPITQGALGAAASMALWSRRNPLTPRAVAGMGWIGGMAPDLDVFIRSSTDPMLAIEFHRHFTHALAFIPVGGVVAALPWLVFRRWRAMAPWVVAATTLGYATHGLLDACTTYGTLLFWPFSNTRVSWRWVSVVDPLVTLPLLGAVVAAAWRQRVTWARWGLAWAGMLIAVGVWQHQRAAQAQDAVAQARGHAPERRAVFPMFANNVAWRAVYQTGDTYYVDKVRVPWWGPTCVTEGTQVPVLEDTTLVSLGAGHPVTERAVRLFRWFAHDWVAWDPQTPATLGDLRYSFSPTEALPIWGVQVDPPSGAVRWINNRSRRDLRWRDLVELVARDGPQARCWP